MGVCRKIRVAPSILSADFRTLEREIRAVEEGGADLIHCDVMDGHFVPNITMGPFIVEAVKRCASVPLDVHLMIENPEQYIASFCDAGADTVTIHAEACKNLPLVLDAIRSRGVRAGVTVNPDKPVDLFLPYLDRVDLVLIMTVFAGFGGQQFLDNIMPKVRSVYDAAAGIARTIDLEVDGGINSDTAVVCSRNGANVFVAGSYVFGAPDYSERIGAIRRGAEAECLA